MQEISIGDGFLVLEDEALEVVESLLQEGKIWGYLSNLINEQVYKESNKDKRKEEPNNVATNENNADLGQLVEMMKSIQESLKKGAVSVSQIAASKEPPLQDNIPKTVNKAKHKPSKKKEAAAYVQMLKRIKGR